MDQSDSIKLSWLRNPASESHRPDNQEIQIPLMRKSHGRNHTTTISSEIDDEEVFEKLASLIKGGSRKGAAKIKQFLQDNEQGLVTTLRERVHGQTLCHVAASEGNDEIVQILLDAGSDPNISDYKGRSPLHAVVDSGCRCKTCSEKRVVIITALINAGASPDPEDNDGHTPLYYCALRLYSAEAKTLLTFDASVHHDGKDGKSIATMLAEYLPDALRYELDSCIGYSSEDSLKLQVDFRLLLQIDVDGDDGIKSASNTSRQQNSKQRNELPPRETELLQSVLKAKAGYDLILAHPVVEAFLYFKWMVVRKLFFILRSIYFMVLLLYTWLMFRIYSNKCIDDYYFGRIGTLCPVTDFDTIGAMIIYGVVGIVAISEFYKLYTNFDGYFSQGSTGCLWWILCIGWASTLIPVFGPPPLYYHFPIAAASVIFSWLMNLVQLGRMPWFALHVGILVKVVIDFVRLLFTFLTVLVAFTLGFCILLNENPNFDNNIFALFKTFMMMKGDLDYEGIMNKTSNSFLDFPEYSIPAHVIYTIFVIVVTMVLTGLLIGLAVKDIEEAIRQTKVNRSIRLIKEIGVFESLIRNKVFTCWMAKWLCKWYSIERTKEIKDYQLTFSPLHPDDRTLPADIKNSFLSYYDNGVCQRQNHRRRKLRD